MGFSEVIYVPSIAFSCRITSIIKRLCRELGHLLVKGKNEGGSGLACITWYSFPSIEAIAGASEQKLRSIGKLFLVCHPSVTVYRHCACPLW